MNAAAPRPRVYVSPDQVSAARALIRLEGGEDKVEPIIVKIAHARPRSEVEGSQAS